MQEEATVAERLRLRLGELTQAERKVARALMADYPVAGLEPVTKLAAAAGVSAPTVVRLVAKLEFDGYAEFQQSLKSEVSARLSSPLQKHAGLPAPAGRAPAAAARCSAPSGCYAAGSGRASPGSRRPTSSRPSGCWPTRGAA